MASFKQNISYVYAVNLIIGLLSVIFIPFCLKRLGSDGYGLYSIYTVLISFTSLLNASVGKNLMRLLTSEDSVEKKTFHLQSAFGLYLLISLSVFLLMPFWFIVVPSYIFPVTPENITKLKWIIVFVCVEFLFAVPISLIQTNCVSRDNFGSYSRFTLLTGLYRYMFMLVAVWFSKSAVVLVGFLSLRKLLDVWTANSVMGAIPKGAWRPTFSGREFRSMTGDTAGFLFSQSMQTILLACGSFLVNSTFGLTTLGIYRAAFDLASRIWFFSNGLSVVLYPRFTRAFANPLQAKWLADKYDIILKTSLSWYMTIAGIAVLMTPVIFKMFKIDNQPLLQLFILLLPALCLFAHSTMSYELLTARGNYRLTAILNMIAMSVLFAGFFSLRSLAGILAIGWSWWVSQIINVLLIDYFALKKCCLNAVPKAQFCGYSFLLCACLFFVMGVWSTDPQKYLIVFTIGLIFVKFSATLWRMKNNLG